MPAFTREQVVSVPPLIETREVFLLGAGFSKAIASAMPTLDELGHRIVRPFMEKPSFNLLPQAAADAMESGRLPGGNLEVWLSNLAAPAPFLDAVERLQNSAIALELVRLIVDDIERSEAIALGSPMPYWLQRLVTLWDRLNATVITFNFDTLVEQAVNASQMPWIQWPRSDATFLEGVAVPLFKMHGSINWWWIPGDRLGTTVQPQPLPGRWGDPQLPGRIPGNERFVIPPLAVKSEYYDLQFTRDVWQSSRDALDGASRVVLMGYSAPVTDLTTVALLSNYLNPKTECVVVDVSPDQIVRRLEGLGLRNVHGIGGEQAIEHFVAQYEVDTSRKVASALVASLDSADIYQDSMVIARVAGTPDEPHFFVTNVLVEGDTSAVVASALPAGEAPWKAKKFRDFYPSIAEAAKAQRRLVLRVGNEPDRAVLTIRQRNYFNPFVAVEA